MTTFDQALKNITAAQHCLMIGHTKMGKTDWLVQAVIDGFTAIVIDKDNAMATLAHRLRDQPVEVQQRLIYFAPKRMSQFIEGFMSEAIYRHNMRTNERVSFMDLQPDDRIMEIIPSRIPSNVILNVNSWTSLSNDIIEAKAERSKIDLFDIDKHTREIYGAVGFRATQFAIMLQNAPFHVVVEAHPGVFERKERPTGVVGDVDEKQMIIKETVMIPLSVSMPHGFTMGKFFNQIGWFEVDRMGNRKLDFRTIHGRIGGGTPGGVGDPRKEYSFSNLFGGGNPTARIDPDKPWLRYITGEELKAQTGAKPGLQSGNIKTPAQVTTTPQAAAPAQTQPARTGFQLPKRS